MPYQRMNSTGFVLTILPLSNDSFQRLRASLPEELQRLRLLRLH